MNLLFIIGGIAVLTGITYMTVAYFQQAKELRETQERLDWCKPIIEEYFTIMDQMQNYEIASEDDVRDLKFGEF